MLLLAVSSGNFPLAQLVERLDTQTEGPWFESLRIPSVTYKKLHTLRKEMVYLRLSGGGNTVMDGWESERRNLLSHSD